MVTALAMLRSAQMAVLYQSSFRHMMGWLTATLWTVCVERAERKRGPLVCWSIECDRHSTRSTQLISKAVCICLKTTRWIFFFFYLYVQYLLFLSNFNLVVVPFRLVLLVSSSLPPNVLRHFLLNVWVTCEYPHGFGGTH